MHRRLLAGGTRRAVQLQGERECSHPLCDEPAERCDIDHVQPWAEGGITIDENGRPACSWHNRHRHRQPAGTPP